GASSRDHNTIEARRRRGNRSLGRHFHLSARRQDNTGRQHSLIGALPSLPRLAASNHRPARKPQAEYRDASPDIRHPPDRILPWKHGSPAALPIFAHASLWMGWGTIAARRPGSRGVGSGRARKGVLPDFGPCPCPCLCPCLMATRPSLVLGLEIEW